MGACRAVENARSSSLYMPTWKTPKVQSFRILCPLCCHTGFLKRERDENKFLSAHVCIRHWKDKKCRTKFFFPPEGSGDGEAWEMSSMGETLIVTF